MKFKAFLILSLIICGIETSHSQTFLGPTMDSYSGIQGVSYNPANIVNSKYRLDITLFSVNGLIGNDYIGVNLGELLKLEDDFEIEDSSNKNLSNANNFYINTEVIGPSFYFNLNEKSSIGIITKARALANINSLNGELIETIFDGFSEDEDFDLDSQNTSGTVHGWAEIGLSYGRILYEKENQVLSAGVTLKYLKGVGGYFFRSNSIEGQYDASAQSLTSSGNLIYGAANDFDADDINFDNLSSGFGADIGFNYTFYPEDSSNGVRNFTSKHLLKLGLSVTDIGSINYKDTTISNYNLNSTVSTADYDDDLIEFLDENYSFTETNGESKFKLPTALHVMCDYNLTGKLFVSVQGDFSLTKKEEGSNAIMNTATLSPRLETKWASLYMPIGFRQYGDFSWGAGARIGPLLIGSGSIISNLISDDSQSVDLYVGLKIPLFRKAS